MLVCACACTCKCMQVYMRMHADRGQGSTLYVTSQEPTTLFLETGSLTRAWSSSIRLGFLVSDVQGSSPPPQCWDLKDGGAQGGTSSSSHLLSKHFTDWTTYPHPQTLTVLLSFAKQVCLLKFQLTLWSMHTFQNYIVRIKEILLFVR